MDELERDGLNINEDYVMLNQKLLHEITSKKIDADQTVYYTIENDLIHDYYVDINEAQGPIAGMLPALDLAALLFAGNFKY